MSVLLHDRKIIFLRPMKTGGSTIRRFIMELNENNENLKGKVVAPHTILHHPWWVIKKYVGDNIWNEYTKIASVRNPWDMLVSLYFYNIDEGVGDPEQSFSSFIYDNSWYRVTASHMLFDDELLQVDDVIKLETINEDIKRIFNIDCTLHENKGISRPSRDYKEMYDDKLVEHVRDICYREIEKFNYDY